MRRRRVIISILVIVGLPAVWFLAVDKSFFVEGCDDCLWQRWITQYRLCTIPIHEQTEEGGSYIHLIARDLGVPCPHKAFYRYHKQRWWGLRICARPCIKGMVGMSGPPPWHNEARSSKIIAMAAADPCLPEEFRQHVLYEHDWAYFNQFKDKVAEYRLD